MFTRSASCTLALGALLVFASSARAEGKKDFSRIIFAGEGHDHGKHVTVSASYTRAGVTHAVVRVDVGGNPVENEFNTKLSEADLKAFVAAYQTADERKIGMKKDDKERALERDGTFKLSIEYTDHTVRDLEGTQEEFPGLRPFLSEKVMVLYMTSGELIENGARVVMLSQTGPARADGAAPWTLEMTLYADGTLAGSYKNLDNTPSGRRNGNFKGTLSSEALAGLEVSAKLIEPRAKVAKDGSTFALKIAYPKLTTSLSGMLSDHPEVAEFAKKLSAFAGEFDKQQRVTIVRAGLAPPSVPVAIVDKYDGPVDPAGVYNPEVARR